MSEYTLRVTEMELARYRLMAEVARTEEVGAWAEAGVVPGATVADVGCGPAAISVLLAELVGPEGRVIGVEREAEALAAAEQMVASVGVGNVELRQGEATATGIEPGSVDVVMMRHVLAHNGGHEQQIVDHLASLVRPGGSVYIVDVDLSAIRLLDIDEDLADLSEKYVEFHRGRGNDPLVGLRLAQFLSRAGLTNVTHRGWYTILPIPPGMRPPAWAASDSMVSDGVVDEADVARWGAAFERSDNAIDRPTLFAAGFAAVGRRSG